VLAMSTSLGPDAPAELSDLRLVAKEFVDLSTQRLAAAKPAVPAAPASVGAPAAAAGETRAAAALNQVLPAWTRRDGTMGSQTLTGEVLVIIDETGQVISAKTTKVSDPSYDLMVVDAARKWRYSPAMRNGKPLPSEKTITYVLKPR
jgi:TonB family protein